MNVDLSSYRASASEQDRIGKLLALIPVQCRTCLDIGARDSYISLRLTEGNKCVTALDLTRPATVPRGINYVQGSAASLPFRKLAFDVVLCAEVLEHIPPSALKQVCAEIVRVTQGWAVIGVPLNQDRRFGATRCPSCGQTNPPWGHINSFSAENLIQMLEPLKPLKVEYVGETRERTNTLSYQLMEFAGHPYGNYSLAEPCMRCGAPVVFTDQRSLSQRIATRAAHLLNLMQQRLIAKRPMWVHVLFEKV